MNIRREKTFLNSLFTAPFEHLAKSERVHDGEPRKNSSAEKQEITFIRGQQQKIRLGMRKEL